MKESEASAFGRKMWPYVKSSHFLGLNNSMIHRILPVTGWSGKSVKDGMTISFTHSDEDCVLELSGNIGGDVLKITYADSEGVNLEQKLKCEALNEWQW